MKRISLLLIFGLSCDAAVAEPNKIATAVAPVEMAQSDGMTHADDVAPRSEVPPVRVTDAPNEFLNAVRQNDFAAFLVSSYDHKSLADIAGDWEADIERRRAAAARAAEEQVEAHTDSAPVTADSEMENIWSGLRSDQGIDLLVAKWQPQFAGANEHIRQMTHGFADSLTSEDLTAEQVEERGRLLNAVNLWTSKTDFTDPLRLRRALQAISKAVRATGLEKSSELRDMRFEDAVVHGDQMISAIKQAVLAYDVDVDQILDSVRFSEVDAIGDTATLRIEATLFGVTVTHHARKQYRHNTWLDADTVRFLQSHDGDSDEAFADLDAAVDATEVEAESDSAPSSSTGSCSPDADYGKEATVEVE